MATVLGLDLGTNSIGWGLVSEASIVDLGVRIFQRSVEDKNSVPKNQKRRTKRLLRRVIQRRAQRRKNLEAYLISHGLLPQTVANSTQRESLLNSLGEPYQLRSDALSRPLEKHELGRVLLHLGSRRGFLSTRELMLFDLLADPDVKAVLQNLENQAQAGDSEASTLKNEAEKLAAKEEGETKKAIFELTQKMGTQTLGQYLYSLPETQRKRDHRTSRHMYQDELKRIIQTQQPYHQELSERFLEDIENIIFYQRPIRWDKNTIGKCSLEPKRIRTHAARLEYQKFRYWQDLHNIRWTAYGPYLDTETGEVILNQDNELSLKQKREVARTLENQKSITWAALKKQLKLPKCSINLEESKKGLTGNLTACSLRKIYPRWNTLSPSEQEQLVEDLLSFEKITPLKNRLINFWHCNIETAVKLIDFSRENTSLRTSLSLNALKKLLPLMMEQNMSFTEAKKAAGYSIETENKNIYALLPEPPQIPNPIVQKALYEVRKVVNAVIKTHGKPDAIHVELPRDFLASKKQKDKIRKQQDTNKKANDRATEQYESIRQRNPNLKLPLTPRFDDLLKFRLWEEQGEICVYSGNRISAEQLFSSAVEIDHILPYTRTVNDSYMNKVVCFVNENRSKTNRTPYEAFTGEKYDQICARAKKLPPTKSAAFFLKDLSELDNFINSQLNDTAYISREVMGYLKQLFAKPTQVISTKGTVTALLRSKWQLNNILGKEQKNREDHRQHAIDAAVIALTDRERYKQIVSAIKSLPSDQQNTLKYFNLDSPWPSFFVDLTEKIDQMIVAHAPNHKLTGALHKDTAYGLQKNDRGGFKVVYRIALNGDFDKNKINNVVDPDLKILLTEHLNKFGGKPKEAFAPENLPIRHKKQGKIRHVRVIAAENYNAETYMAIKDKRLNKINTVYHLRNNHHMEILQFTQTSKYKSILVSTLEATNRARRLKHDIVQTDHGPEWKLTMVLHINDLVEATKKKGLSCIYRVQKMSEGDVTLRLHTAATDKYQEDQIRAAPESLVKKYHMKPVRITTLGKRLTD